MNFSCPPDSFLLKDFIEYFCSSRVFFSYLETFRSLLINFTITFPIYEKIIKRINFIYTSSSVLDSSNPNIIEGHDRTLSETTSGDGLSESSIITSQSNIIRNNPSQLHITDSKSKDLKNKIPSESCVQYIVRVLFTNNPPPYFYDYSIENPSEKSFDKVIYSIKQMFNNSELRPTSFHDRPSLSPQFINRSLNSKSVVIKKSEKLYQINSPSHFSLRLTNNGNNSSLDSNPIFRSKRSKLNNTQIFPIEESIDKSSAIV